MNSCCIVCWEDITTPVTYGETTLKYCFSCVKDEIENHYPRWRKSVDQADCAASLRRMISKPPPMTFADVCGMTVANEVRLRCGVETIGAKLKGSPEDESQRQKLWEELSKINCDDV